MDIILLNPAELTPYPGNPRVIPQSAIEAVAESITRFGFRQPIVVDTSHIIIVGHVRHQAALRLGLAEVPVHVADELTEDETAALRLVDNRTAEFTTWDQELLDSELAQLSSSLGDLMGLFSQENFSGPPPKAQLKFGNLESPWGKREQTWLDQMRSEYGDGLEAELERRLFS